MFERFLVLTCLLGACSPKTDDELGSTDEASTTGGGEVDACAQFVTAEACEAAANESHCYWLPVRVVSDVEACVAQTQERCIGADQGVAGCEGVCPDATVFYREVDEGFEVVAFPVCAPAIVDPGWSYCGGLGDEHPVCPCACP